MTRRPPQQGAALRVVAAFNAFKGVLTADEAGAILAAAARRAGANVEVVCIPMADGGDGTGPVLARALGLRRHTARVHGPRCAPCTAAYYTGTAAKHSRPLAVLEMAEASGLRLLTKPQRDPLRTTSFGTGELLRTILAKHPRAEVFIGVGGSATIDGGAGALQALGARFLARDGTEMREPITGGRLADIAGVDLAPARRLTRHARLCILCDVRNPLTGPRGAARVFGPQKGATPAAVARLDAGLRHWARVLANSATASTAKPAVPGAGAAGGFAFGLAATIGARLEPGAKTIADAAGLDRALRGAHLVFTGEGSLDAQTLDGKAPAIVAERARQRGALCVALCGMSSLTPARARRAGFTLVGTMHREAPPRIPTPAATRRWLAGAADAVFWALSADEDGG